MGVITNIQTCLLSVIRIQGRCNTLSDQIYIFLRFWFYVHVQQQWDTEARGGDIYVYCIASWYTL